MTNWHDKKNMPETETVRTCYKAPWHVCCFNSSNCQL